MSQSNSERITTRIKTMPGQGRAIIFDLEHFWNLSQAYADEMGRTLVETADTDPVEAYSFLRAALGQHAAQNVFGLAIDNYVADEHTHGTETTHELAEVAIRRYLPQACEGAGIVYVCAEPGETDAMMGITEPIQLLKLCVTPPGLAA